MRYRIVLPEGREDLREIEGIGEFLTAVSVQQTESAMRRLKGIVPDIRFEPVEE